MSGVFRQSFDDTNNAQETELLGGTDQTKIGNVGDRLKVDAAVSTTTGRSSWSSKLKYIDMNTSSGGLARGTAVTTTITTIFSYSGSGYVIGFDLNLETGADWLVHLIVDGDTIFDTTGIAMNDIISDALYDLDDSGKSIPELASNLGLQVGAHNTFQWSGPLATPIKYSSSVVVRIQRATGAATKKFLAGLMLLTKDT